MSRFKNPLYELPSFDDVAVARRALRSAAAARSATARERAYLTAAGALFDPDLTLDWHAREVAYAKAMEGIVNDTRRIVRQLFFMHWP